MNVSGLNKAFQNHMVEITPWISGEQHRGITHSTNGKGSVSRGGFITANM